MQRKTQPRRHILSRLRRLQWLTAMAAKVDPVPSKVNRQPEWAATAGVAGRYALHCQGNAGQQQDRLFPGFGAAGVQEVLPGCSAPYSSQGGSRHCPPDLGSSGLKSANWAKSHGHQNLSFVSEILSPFLPPVVGFQNKKAQRIPGFQ